MWQTPHAASRTSTSPASGSASSTSWTTSGCPNSSSTAARIFIAGFCRTRPCLAPMALLGSGRCACSSSFWSRCCCPAAAAPARPPRSPARRRGGARTAHRPRAALEGVALQAGPEARLVRCRPRRDGDLRRRDAPHRPRARGAEAADRLLLRLSEGEPRPARQLRPRPRPGGEAGGDRRGVAVRPRVPRLRARVPSAPRPGWQQSAGLQRRPRRVARLPRALQPRPRRRADRPRAGRGHPRAVDPRADRPVRRRARLLVSAILLGGNVTVAQGSDTGGSFEHVPACSAPDQTGCVVAYDAWDRTPARGAALTAQRGTDAAVRQPGAARGRPGAGHAGVHVVRARGADARRAEAAGRHDLDLRSPTNMRRAA